MILELLSKRWHGFRKQANKFFAFAQLFPDGLCQMSRQDSRGQPGTLEIGPVEPRELNAPSSRHGFAGEDFGGVGEGFPPGIEIGVELARNSVQRQEGFAQEEKVDRHWMALQSQLLHDLERRVQWIARAPWQRDPNGFPISLEEPPQDVWRRLLADDAVKTECDERVA